LVWIAFLRLVFPASISFNFAAEGPPSRSPCYLPVLPFLSTSPPKARRRVHLVTCSLPTGGVS
jgi:hypothetical protein